MSKPIDKEYLYNTLISFDEQVLNDEYVKKEESHTHNNKDVLDVITTEKIAVWDKSEQNVQSDWNEIDSTSDAYIKNKPTSLPSNGGNSDTVNGHTVESDVPVDAKFTDTVYNDTDIKAEIAKKADATAIPSKVSVLENDSKYQTESEVNSIVTTEIAKVVADAPEDLNTLKEMSDWIAGHEDDASAMNSAISDNKTAIASLQSGKADKSEIPTTLPANGGNADTVNNHTVKTDVPTDAVFTDTIYDDTEVKESIAELNSNLVEQEMLGWIVPKECPVQNEVSGNQFVQKVGRVDLGSLSWDLYTEERCIFRSTPIADIKLPEDTTIVPNLYVKGYTAVPSGITWTNKMISIGKSSKLIYICDTNYTTAEAFKNAMQGVYLYYELEEENLIKVDGNEAVTRVNESLGVIGKCKNLLNPTLQTTALNGVACTNNGDGTYNIVGTNNTSSNITFICDVSINGTGQVKLLGVPKGSSGIILQTNYDGSWSQSSYWDSGNGAVLPNIEKLQRLAILVYAGATVNHTIKPMITTDLNATYDDFVPYTGNGDTLTHDVAKLKQDLDALTNYHTEKTLIGKFCGLNHYRNVYTGVISPSSGTINIPHGIATSEETAYATNFSAYGCKIFSEFDGRAYIVDLKDNVWFDLSSGSSDITLRYPDSENCEFNYTIIIEYAIKE